MTEDRHVLRRLTDGLFFCDPHGVDNREWSSDIRQARQWFDQRRADAAASTWLKIKGEALEVVRIWHEAPMTLKQREIAIKSNDQR